MATYNGESFLEEQLKSFSEQSVLPDELIVVDDCSNDHSCEILERFRDTCPFKIEIFKNLENYLLLPVLLFLELVLDVQHYDG